MERVIRRIKRSLADPSGRAFWKVMGIIALVLAFDFTSPLSTDLNVRGLSIIGALLVLILFKVYEIAELLRARRVKPKGPYKATRG